MRIPAGRRAAAASLQRRGPRWARRRRTVMADLAYALLLIGGFGLLVLTLRGLQRL